MSGKREECPKEKSTLSSAWEGKGAMDAYCPGEPELSLLLSRLIYLPFFFFFFFSLSNRRFKAWKYRAGKSC